MNFSLLKDDQLISNIRDNNCSDSLVELTNRHHGLLVQIMRKYAGAAPCSGVAMQDFLDDANLIVFDAVNKFNPEKEIKFSTWLGNTTKYYCLNTLNKQSKYYSSDSEDFGTHMADTLTNEAEQEKNLIEQHLEFIKNILSQIKDKRIEKIITMRYLNGKTKKESFSVIAKSVGMSPQGVIDLHDSFINFVREKMKSETYMDKI